MTDELVSKSQMKRVAIQKGDALPPRRICEHGSQEVKCLICENAALEDEIERLRAEVACEERRVCDLMDALHASETELAALRKRVEDAPVQLVHELKIFDSYVIFVPPALDGKRVRLVVEDWK